MPRTIDPRPLSLPDVAVADVMHAGIVVCPPQTPVAEIARAMGERRIHAVVVEGLTRDPRGVERLVWGAVSDRDLIAAAIAGTGTVAEDLASTELVSVTTTDSLLDAARYMVEHDVSHVLVVEPGTERPVGIVSTLDVARVLADES